MTLSSTMHLRVLLREDAMKAALFSAKLVHLASAYALTICSLCCISRSDRLIFDNFLSELTLIRRFSNKVLLQRVKRYSASRRSKCSSVLTYCELISRRHMRLPAGFLNVH